jgi:hypothetical protein
MVLEPLINTLHVETMGTRQNFEIVVLFVLCHTNHALFVLLLKAFGVLEFDRVQSV